LRFAIEDENDLTANLVQFNLIDENKEKLKPVQQITDDYKCTYDRKQYMNHLIRIGSLFPLFLVRR
jgi:hypothetical protein